LCVCANPQGRFQLHAARTSTSQFDDLSFQPFPPPDPKASPPRYHRPRGGDRLGNQVRFKLRPRLRARLHGHVIGTSTRQGFLRRSHRPGARPDLLRSATWRNSRNVAGPVMAAMGCGSLGGSGIGSIFVGLGHLRTKKSNTQHRLGLRPRSFRRRQEQLKVFKAEQEVRPEGSRLHLCDRSSLVAAMMRTSFGYFPRTGG